MSNFSKKPDDFGKDVVNFMRSQRPEYSFFHTGDLDISVDGNYMNIADLFKMCNLEPERSEEIVLNYFFKLFNFQETSNIDISDFISVSENIMPRIFSENHGSQVSLPWINGCVISFVVDFPEVCVGVSDEMMYDWGLFDAEELYSFALKNLWRDTKGVEFDVIKINDEKENSFAKACIIHNLDGYDSSRILLPQIYENLRSDLGNEFYVGIPSRDVFFALSSNCPSITQKVAKKVREDSGTLPHPISPNLFLCVQDGIAPAIFD